MTCKAPNRNELQREGEGTTDYILINLGGLFLVLETVDDRNCVKLGSSWWMLSGSLRKIIGFCWELQLSIWIQSVHRSVEIISQTGPKRKSISPPFLVHTHKISPHILNIGFPSVEVDVFYALLPWVHFKEIHLSVVFYFYFYIYFILYIYIHFIYKFYVYIYFSYILLLYKTTFVFNCEISELTVLPLIHNEYFAAKVVPNNSLSRAFGYCHWHAVI